MHVLFQAILVFLLRLSKLDQFINRMERQKLIHKILLLHKFMGIKRPEKEVLDHLLCNDLKITFSHLQLLQLVHSYCDNFLLNLIQ